MLARIRKAMDEREGGFTLIELLVVIIIIGILAAIAIPVFLNQRKKGYEASMKSDLRTVANEMETYFTDAQIYPATSTVTGTPLVVGTGGNSVTLSAGNTIKVKSSDANSFCLDATSSKTTALWSYNSASGGVTKGACP
ncbi:MAG: type pilus assembly protein PilA [Frankiales bacterium]|jgi:prepilin-type N-terminal cleavage/methylation domain-containing protein|nr:type pilus assembly protein PilA [Frankiales bacterium]